MSVTEKLMAPGQFNLTLDKSITPNTIINQLDAWGQIVIIPADLNVEEYSDATLLSSASYVGIVYSLELGEEDSVNVFGQGLAAYLGDSETRGMPISETGGNAGVRSYINSTLANVLDYTGTPKGLLRDESGSQGAIRKGTITEPTDSSTYTGKHYTESAMKAIKYVCQDLGVEFKISTSGYLDAGPVGTIFSGHSSDPTSIIVRDASGEDPNIDGVATTSLLAQYDASEFVSQVELIASKYGAEANIGNATASSIPYKDIFGNDLKRVQYVSDPQTQGTSKTTRASAYLNELNTIKKTLNVSLEEYDISGDFVVGDKIFIYDPDIGFVDTDADKTLDGRSDLFEVVYQGQVLNPTKIRILGVTWPIKLGYGVFYRDKNGNYTELTDYCIWEDGDVQLEIGDVAPTIGESLGFSGYTVDQTGSPDKSVPGQPTDTNGNVGLNTISGSYSDGNGISKAFIKVTWNQPLNSDGSAITDGAYYRLRYRVVQDTDGNNIIDSSDTQVVEYIYSTVDFNTREFIIYDLSPNTYYEIGVQAIDISGFDSAFSTVSSVQTSSDAGAPNKPDGFATIASNALRVQFIHNLGQAKNDSGNPVSPFVDFTLAKDLDHLNIYASTTQGFSLNYNSTTNKVTNSGFKIGELKATSSHIQNGIAAVGYIDLDNASTHYFRVTAVDSSGNESEPSDEQTGSAELINTSHIANLAVTNAVIANAAITDAKVADLSAGKITAGTISGQTIILNASGDTGNDSDIRSSNYATGTAGWRINSDGVAEFQNATIRGSLNASDITSGTLSSDRLDTDFIAVGGAATDINDGSTTIDGGNITTNSITTNQLNFTPLQDGDAITDGTIAGITINSSAIQSTNFDSSNGFQISSNGDAIFRDVTIRGTLEGTTLTDNLTLNGGTVRTSSSGSRVEIKESSSVGMINFYDDASELTMSLQASTDEFQMVGGLDDNVKISTVLGKELEINAGTIKLNAYGNASGGPINLGTPGTNNISQVDVKIGIAGNNGNYDYGTAGQVLQSNATGVSWETVAGHNHTGITFPNAGTILSDNTHSHNTDFSNFASASSLLNHVANNSNAHGIGNKANNSDLGNKANNSDLGNKANSATVSALSAEFSGHVGDNNHGGLSNSHTNSANAHGQSNITGLVLALAAKKNNGALPNNHDNNEHNVTYVTAAHNHINAHAHDDRMLVVNSNTVPGINVVKRMTPITANFTNTYGDVLETYTGSVPEIRQDRYRLTYQDVKQAFIDDGLDPTNIGYFVEDLDYVEDEAKADLPSGETMKGLMDGELEPILVKSIQDLYDMIELLQARVDELEGA